MYATQYIFLDTQCIGLRYHLHSVLQVHTPCTGEIEMRKAQTLLGDQEKTQRYGPSWVRTRRQACRDTDERVLLRQRDHMYAQKNTKTHPSRRRTTVRGGNGGRVRPSSCQGCP